ncbi:MAG: phage virion morphogenesis protein [Alistipes sp.]
MTPKEFKARINKMYDDAPEFMQRYAPMVAGKAAKQVFKHNFQTESFDGKKWKQVQRRDGESAAYKYASKHHPARTARKILTGDTADLGRSIEIKEIGDGKATIWTSPQAFGSKEPYGAVHNEGLKAGRGVGFTMPKRQFIGDSPELKDKVVAELERQMSRLLK